MQELEQAVLVALQGNGSGHVDASLKSQAIEYLNQVRDSPDGWRTCLDVFGNQSLNENTRLYALKVIDHNLPSLNADQVSLIRNTLFQYYQQLASNQLPATLPNHMKNKLAQTMGYVFVMTYQNQWPTFFDDLLSLTASPDSPVGNTLGSDMYLKVLRMIHEEIGDTLVLRSAQETARNNMLKDLVRERAMVKLAESWLQVLQYYSAKDPAIIESCLNVIGGWVSWIEISLVVGPEYRSQIFKSFAVPELRISACNALNEILSKKMKDSHKLELLQLLDFNSVLAQLPSLKSDNELEFEERLAKLTNTVGSSLVKICDSSDCTDAERAQAEQMLLGLMPNILLFLANEYDDTSIQVLGTITEYLQLLRKEAKKGPLPPHRREVVGFMLEKIIQKSAYEPDADWTGGEDESESEFLDLRTKLKVLQEIICSIDSALYVEGVTSIVTNAFAKPAGGKKPWQEIELGLYELDSLGESVRNTAFQKRNPRAVQALEDLFFQMVLSDTVIYANHPSISLWFMELVNKHSNLITSHTPSEVPSKAVQVFLSDLGVHSSHKRVQVRAWYLFYKFIRAVRGLMGNIGGAVFESLAPLLTIRARIPQDDSDDSGLENGVDSEFTSQLYLFELLGMLFGMSGDNSTTNRLLQSIFADIERCLNQPQKTQLVTLQLHHNIMVIGSFAKGFEEVYGQCGIPPDSGDDTKKTSGQQARMAASRPCLEELKNASQVIAVTLDRSRDSSDIREASRIAFSRLVSLLGSEILPQVSVLIAVILQESSLSEFGDFLGFLGHYIHSFRQEQQVFDMFVSLVSPLVEKTFSFIKPATEESSGTDALIAVEVLRRAYLQFLFNVLNNGFGAVFIIEPNNQAGLLDAVIQSVYHYATDLSDPTTQKTAIVALSKMLQVWNTGVVTSQFGQGLQVPIFSSDSILEQLSSVAWTIASKPKFNARDAQTRLVLLELGALQKSMYEVYGQKYVMFLGETYLPQLGLPMNLIQEYCTQLCELAGKDFKQYFAQFMAKLSS